MESLMRLSFGVWKMKHRILQILFLAVALFVMVDEAPAKDQGTSLVVSDGGTRCNRWIEVRAAKASVLAFGLENWALGFLLGMKIESDGQSTKLPIESPTWLTNVTEDDALARIDNYCRIHRMDYLIQAVLMTAADLIDEHAANIRLLTPSGK
jgi:hypothetical protein